MNKSKRHSEFHQLNIRFTTAAICIPQPASATSTTGRRSQ